jgi:hypothetical protein
MVSRRVAEPEALEFCDHSMKSAAKFVLPGLRREALLCFTAIFFTFMLTTNGNDNSEEAAYSYRVAKQILTAHSIGFSEPQTGVFNRAPDGRFYESYDLGNTLFMLPTTWLDEQVLRRMGPRIGQARTHFVWRFVLATLSPVYCAVSLALIYVMLRTLFGQTKRLALANVIILGFCSFYWNYSRDLADSVLCSTLLCAATLLLFLFGKTQGVQQLIAAFCFLGLGLITRPTMLIPIAAAFLYLGALFYQDWKRLVRVAFIAGLSLIPFVAWQLYYNHFRSGNALVSPLQAFYRADNGLTGDLASHVPGLLISPGKGILVYAPPVFLALFCFPLFFKRYRAEALYTAAIGLGWLLVHAKLANNWYGAWGWGPRHFIAVTPILALPFLVSGWRVFSSKPKAAFASLSLLFGFVLATSATIGDWLYRLGFTVAQGRGERLVWSLTENQAIDMIASSSRNVARLFTDIPFDVVPAASTMNQRASNTVNVWLVTAYHQGIPAIAVLLAAALLLAGAAGCFWRLLRPVPWDSKT